MSDPDDLLKRLLDGNAAAATQVTRWAAESVRARAYGLAAADQEDIAQTVLLEVLRAARKPDFALQKPLRAFVRHVAAARCVDALRRRRPTVPLDDGLMGPIASPYDDLLRNEEAARVRWALQQLGEACRRLIDEHFGLSRTYGEIARREAVSESTLRGRMFQCLKRAREYAAAWRRNSGQ